MSKFQEDLKKGQEYERIATEYFEYKKCFFPKGKFKAYDFILDEKIKVEVKCDRIAHRTGNIAVEYKFKGKYSGIYATKADYFFYFIEKTEGDYNAYKIETETLKKMCKAHGKKMTGGDNNWSRLYLLNVEFLKEYEVIEKKHKPFIADVYESLPTHEKLLSHMKHLENYEELYEIIFNFYKNIESEKRQRDNVMKFGKYKGEEIKKIARRDMNYLRWVYDKPFMDKFLSTKKEIEKFL